MVKLKEQLYLLCVEYIRKHEAEIKTAINEAQEAANDETKSTAGDKFETGREIMQQEIDLNLTRLNELHKIKQTLERIVPGQKGETIQPGSVVYTNNGNYYVAISAGKINVDNSTFYAISAASPIGEKMTGLKTGDDFVLNGKSYKIESIA